MKRTYVKLQFSTIPQKIVYYLIFAIVVLSSQILFSAASIEPQKEYVPNEKTAIRVAEAILEPIYGEKFVKKGRPYKALLMDGEVWLVESNSSKRTGAIVVIEIQKSDCKVLKMYIEKQ
jgi:hypothetical protein